MRAGRMAEWLCRGLQILVQRFDSASGLHRYPIETPCDFLFSLFLQPHLAMAPV
jgi:hypothetical protein